MELPEDELQWRFEPSGGPGGQHANRSATRAVLTFDVAASRAFDEGTRARILERLGDPVVVVEVDDTRSQWRNRQRAVRRLVERLEAAAQEPPPPRRPSSPTAAARRRRIAAKRRRGEQKRLRRPPDDEP